MDSSYMGVDSNRSPVDTMMSALRQQVAAEVKADISEEVMERVIRICSSAFGSITIPTPTVSVTVPPSSVSVASTPALVDITNDMDMSEMCECLKRIETLLSRLISTLNTPVRREVQRDSENLISAVTDRRI